MKQIIGVFSWQSQKKSVSCFTYVQIESLKETYVRFLYSKDNKSLSKMKKLPSTKNKKFLLPKNKKLPSTENKKFSFYQYEQLSWAIIEANMCQIPWPL